MIAMDEGTVAVLDALGTKGLGQAGVSVAAVFERTKRVREAINGYVEASELLREALPDDLGRDWLSVRFFSDTIIISCRAMSSMNGTVPLSIVAVVAAARIAIQVAALPPRGIAYRGAIAYGKFASDQDTVIGDAINEAASLEKVAIGAFVWLAPSAIQRLGDWRDNAKLIEYAVPVRGGERFWTLAVNPLSREEDLAGVIPRSQGPTPSVRDSLLATFRSRDEEPISLEVEIKRQNTERFLKAAADAIAESSNV
jgi:hypothetical protein